VIPVIPENRPARFCWLDLAAADTRGAADFYAGMFGWQARRQAANGGEFLRFTHDGEAIGSLYQLGKRQLADGVPSHWTPYVGVADIDQATARVAGLGGQVAVQPFSVDGVARVSLLVDSVGALIGLWELAE
jgi:hypothetical protein